MKILTYIKIKQFQSYIFSFYKYNKRTFPWRYVDNPYFILVSEIMLQQTQTHRVIHYFNKFINTFPSLHSLADAQLSDVLRLWQGLGYNRRGKYLHDTAKTIVKKYNGLVPDDPQILNKLPGIGKATTGSIAAFAYNKPTIFIETNIRVVYLFHFFHDQYCVTDTELLPLIEQTINTNNPRSWYYALMDYGVYLKKQYKYINKQSAHYTKQSLFKGSDRQIRGLILKFLNQQSSITIKKLQQNTSCELKRLYIIINKMIKEKLITQNNNIITVFNTTTYD